MIRMTPRIRIIVAAAVLAALVLLLPQFDPAARRNHAIEVAVTVDDLPGMGALPPFSNRLEIARSMIGMLKANRAPAYGFANGVQLDADPPQRAVLQAWAAAGFPIGNHTFRHLNLGKTDANTYIADIRRMDQRLAALDLIDDPEASRRIFRYPYLAEGDTIGKRDAVRNFLFGDGYRIAEVTLDYHDWAWNDAYTRCLARHDAAAIDSLKQQAAASAMRHLSESIGLARMLFGRDIRHILLIHIGAFEAVELGATLVRYRRAGVPFITLTRAMADPVYAFNPKYTYAGTDKSFLHQVAASRHLSDPFRDPMDAPEAIAEICR